MAGPDEESRFDRLDALTWYVAHGADDVGAALGSRDARGIGILSARGAACHAGVGWFAALVAEARKAGAVALIDCDDAPGRVLEAQAVPLDGVVFIGPLGLAQRLEAILALRGRVLLRARPVALEPPFQARPRR